MTTPPPSTGNHVWKFLIPILVIIGLVVGGLSLIKQNTLKSQANSDSSAGPATVGTILPDFKVTTLEGVEKSISQIPGKVFLINFWASWCEACMVEMPSIVSLKDRLKDQPFDVLGINVDDNPQAVVPKLITQLKLNFPVYTDAQGRLSELFDVHAIPLTAIINKDRKVLLLQSGDRNWAGTDIQAQIEKWLKE